MKPEPHKKEHGPHGPVVVHRCSGCSLRFATYAGRFPKGWVRLNGQPYCLRCHRRRGR